jgi:hypothetical protein
MSLRCVLFTLGVVIPLSGLASPVVAQDKAGGPPAISLSLKPTSSHLGLRLRAADGSKQAYACEGPCVLEVRPGLYQLTVVDGQRETDWHEVNLSQSETIEVHRAHRGLAIAGTALVATGAALAATSFGAFLYGAVSNLETMDCDTACGGVSAHFIRVSLAGAGLGVVLAAVGAVILYTTQGPTMLEKPGVQPESTASRARSLSFTLVPDFHAPRAPLALMNLSF